MSRNNHAIILSSENSRVTSIWNNYSYVNAALGSVKYTWKKWLNLSSSVEWNNEHFVDSILGTFRVALRPFEHLVNLNLIIIFFPHLPLNLGYEKNCISHIIQNTKMSKWKVKQNKFSCLWFLSALKKPCFAFLYKN